MHLEQDTNFTFYTSIYIKSASYLSYALFICYMSVKNTSQGFFLQITLSSLMLTLSIFIHFFYYWNILLLTQTFLYILVELPKVAAGFREFLKTLKKPAAQDVNDKCKVWVSNS